MHNSVLTVFVLDGAGRFNSSSDSRVGFPYHQSYDTFLSLSPYACHDFSKLSPVQMIIA